MKASRLRPLEILSGNLRGLMLETGNPSTGPAVDKVAKSLGLSVGRTSVTLYTHGKGNPTVNQLEALAKVFGVQAWQLLHPTMGDVHDERPPLVDKR